MLSPENLNLHYIQKADAESGLALIDILPGGDNIIRINAGANGRLTLADVASNSEILKQADILLLQNEIPFEISLAAARTARRGGARVIMDPAPAPDRIWDADILSCFDVITPNETEAEKLLGDRPRDLGEAMEAARALCALGSDTAMITMGAGGIAWFDGKDAFSQATPDVIAIDTVAAGDCFNGGLAASLAAGQSMAEAVKFAAHTAAIAVTRKGASSAAPYLDEVRSSLGN